MWGRYTESIMRKPSKLCWLVVFCCMVPAAGQAQAGNEDEEDRVTAAGQQAMAAGQFEAARTDFEQLAKLEPGIGEVHATLAAIYFQLHQYDLAVEQVHTAQRLKPSLTKLDSLLALSLAEMGRFTDALPHLEKGFKQAADADVRRLCGLQLLRAYTGLGRDSDAVEAALELNKLYPDDPEILYHTGRIYGNFAYVVMEKLHDSAPDSIWMIQAQGEANEAQKSYDAAIAAFNRVLALDPQRPGIHYRIGRVYLTRFRAEQKAEDHDGAVREFMAELQVDPANGNAAYELAYMQAEAGNLEEARTQYEHVVERFPGFEEALVGLGGVLLDLHKPELALAPLQHATEVSPGDEAAWYRLATADRATGDREGQRKALAAFQKVHGAKPTHKSYDTQEISPQHIDAGANP